MVICERCGRDLKKDELLKSLGWSVIRIAEKEIKKTSKMFLIA